MDYKVGDKFKDSKREVIIEITNIDMGFIGPDEVSWKEYKLDDYNKGDLTKAATCGAWSPVFEAVIKDASLIGNSSAVNPNKYYCYHPNKKIVWMITSAHWYCPDCKESLEDLTPAEMKRHIKEYK